MVGFAWLPPETNSLRMYLGAGSRPLLAAAGAWDGLAEELHAAASSFGSVTSELAGGAWQGPASAAMANAAGPYASWLTAAGAQAELAARQARAAAGAFEEALAGVVHPAVVQANRVRTWLLAVSNVFGQNAPAIAAMESTYEQMWAQDVAVMAGYHAASSAAAAQLASWQPALPNINLGVGNIGNLNVGNGNTGDYNLGNGNLGNANFGGGNGSAFHGQISSFNVGSGNIGNFNLGSGNGNVGIGPSSFNVGSGNIGNANVGGGNSGDNNFGFGNFGNANIGIGNAGPNMSSPAVPTPGNGNVGIGNGGNGNFGGGNTGNANIGLGNVGDGNVGLREQRQLQLRLREHRQQ